MKKIIIGNDHGGYDLKVQIVDHLTKQGYDVEDVGSHSTGIVRYPYYAATVAKKVASHPNYRGILLCSTGIGMSIFANKYKGVRAALCYSTYQGKMTAAHNNSNIICLGGRCIGPFEAFDILDAWLITEYEGGRHNISLDLINQAEKTNFSDSLWDPGIPDIQ
ncbi:MAG: ribose 5-phosphate isomerase B [Spirosomataceae bacterium]